jgi:hypothetical protein
VLLREVRTRGTAPPASTAAQRGFSGTPEAI